MSEFDPILRTRLSRFLTSDLLDQLPQPQALTQATQRLNTLHKAIASFLPQYIASDENRLGQDFGGLSAGTFMFADVSGFTALSETLRRQAGAEGIEVLTQIINDYFSTMLEILAKSEGQLLKFAGDALLTFFPMVGQHEEFPRAINTGLRMQRAMQEKFQPIQNRFLVDVFGADHQFELTMSIGVSRGNLFEALVGNLSQRDHIIMGRLPGEADAAEKVGIRDDVIIPAAFTDEYEGQFDFKPMSAEFVQVLDNFGDTLGDYEFSQIPRRRAAASMFFGLDDTSLMADLQNQLNRLETISRFVSSEIVNKLVVKGDHIDSENRLATVIFVHFTGFAELLEAWGDENASKVAVLLSQYYSLMQRVIATHGGVLTRTDPYHLGSKMLITFGAPVAHVDDPERAVQACLDMLRQLEQFNQRLAQQLPQLADLYPFIQQRMGVTIGDVYAGEVGWRQRREYTVMGDEVNLAARLMSRADFGQILISQPVYDRVQTAFATQAMEPFLAKGKSLPIQSYTVLETKAGETTKISDTPFIGREVILMSLNMALKQAERAPARVRAVALYGDIGVGKTRLAQQFAISAQSIGFEVAWATCRTQTNRRATWSTLINQLMRLDEASRETSKEKHLQEFLARLDLSGLNDVFHMLLFDSSDPSRRTLARNQRRRSLKASTNIYDKLSSEQTLAMNKNELANFRKQMKSSFSSASPNSLPSWSELELQVSLTEAIIQLLERLSEKHPILLVIDDLHKENLRALNMLKRIINETKNSRLMILAIYETSAEPNIDFHKVAVGDLPEEQTYMMTSAMLGGYDLGGRLCDFLWESTSGRALFIESLVHNLIDTDQLDISQGMVELRADADVSSLPDDVRGLIISRIDRLSPESRTLLWAAAVLEDQFTLNGLAYVSELDYQLVLRFVEELTQLQLFEEDGLQVFRFKHGVTQQALYEELNRLQRQKLHLRVADFFDRLESSEANTLQAVYHLLKAGAPQQAVSTLSYAAEQAEQTQDIEQALELYTKALEIFPDDGTIQEQIARLQQL